jgi:hypothetical protein
MVAEEAAEVPLYTVSRQKYPNAALWPPRQHDHPKLHEAVDTATHVQIE